MLFQGRLLSPECPLLLVTAPERPKLWGSAHQGFYPHQIQRLKLARQSIKADGSSRRLRGSKETMLMLMTNLSLHIYMVQVKGHK